MKDATSFVKRMQKIHDRVRQEIKRVNWIGTLGEVDLGGALGLSVEVDELLLAMEEETSRIGVPAVRD